MNKLKKVMLGALSVLTLGLFAVVGSKLNVEAMTLSGDNYVASWTNGSDVTGLLWSAQSKTSFVATDTYSQASSIEFSKRQLLIPVPGEDANGTINVVGSATKTRNCYLVNGDGTPSTVSFAMNTNGAQNSFSTSNVLTYNGDYYIGLSAYDSNGTNNDFKASTITITLNSNCKNYSVQYTVSYHLGSSNTVIKEEDISQGSVANPNVHYYGYDITGYYTDSSMENVWSDKTITSDIDIYCSYVPWSTSLYGDGNTLSLDFIEKIGPVFENATTEATSLTGTNYTLQPSVDCVAREDTVGSLGTSSYTIHTKGKSSVSNHTVQNAIKFNAPSNGTIKVFAKSGSSSSIVINMYDSDAKQIDENLAGPLTSSIEGFEFDVTEGVNYIGGTGAIYFYYLSFEATPQVTVSAFQQEATNQTINNKAATYIRFIAIISNADDVKATDFTFKIYRTKDNKTESITRTVSIYSALNLGGETYSATLPGESTLHAFNGNNGTEKYAVFVVGFTNETYKGYTVSAAFNYKGIEYPTTGYEFK